MFYHLSRDLSWYRLFFVQCKDVAGRSFGIKVIIFIMAFILCQRIAVRALAFICRNFLMCWDVVPILSQAAAVCIRIHFQQGTRFAMDRVQLLLSVCLLGTIQDFTLHRKVLEIWCMRWICRTFDSSAAWFSCQWRCELTFSCLIASLSIIFSLKIG